MAKFKPDAYDSYNGGYQPRRRESSSSTGAPVAPRRRRTVGDLKQPEMAVGYDGTHSAVDTKQFKEHIEKLTAELIEEDIKEVKPRSYLWHLGRVVGFAFTFVAIIFLLTWITDAAAEVFGRTAVNAVFLAIFTLVAIATVAGFMWYLDEDQLNTRETKRRKK